MVREFIRVLEFDDCQDGRDILNKGSKDDAGYQEEV